VTRPSLAAYANNPLQGRFARRIVPELRFFYDEGQDRQSRVEQLLHEIETERKR